MIINESTLSSKFNMKQLIRVNNYGELISKIMKLFLSTKIMSLIRK